MKSKVLTCLCAIAQTKCACAPKKFCANPRDQLYASVKFWKDPCSGFRVLFRTRSAAAPAQDQNQYNLLCVDCGVLHADGDIAEVCDDDGVDSS